MVGSKKRTTTRYHQKMHSEQRLWTSNGISTETIVGKVLIYAQRFSYPELFRARYNACPAFFIARKLLIFQLLTALSTKKRRFTIYYYFLYIPLL